MCPAVCWIWGARLAREKRGRRAGKTQLLGFSLERSRKFSIDPCPSCLKRLETKGLVFQPTCTEYQLHVAIYLANHIICPAASRHCLVGDEVGKRVAFEFQSRLLKAFQKESFFFRDSTSSWYCYRWRTKIHCPFFFLSKPQWLVGS